MKLRPLAVIVVAGLVVGLFGASIVSRDSASASAPIGWNFPLLDSVGAAHDPVEGSDGNMWFLVDGSTVGKYTSIDRVSPSGQLSEFPLPSSVSVGEIPILGPDGNLWLATEQGVLLKITPQGDITQTQIPTGEFAPEAGVNGTLWFVSFQGKLVLIGKHGEVTQFTVAYPGDGLKDAAVDADGNLWLTSIGVSDGPGSPSSYVFSVDTTGTLTVATNPFSAALTIGLKASGNGTIYADSDNGGVARLDGSNTFDVVLNGPGPGALVSQPGSGMWFYSTLGGSFPTDAYSIGLTGVGPLITVPLEGAPVASPFLSPCCTVSDSSGDLWLAAGSPDSIQEPGGNLVPSETASMAEVTPSGIVTIRASLSDRASFGFLRTGPNGTLWALEQNATINSAYGPFVDTIDVFDPDGSEQRFPLPAPIESNPPVFDDSGQAWFTDNVNANDETQPAQPSAGSYSVLPPVSESRVAGVDRYETAVQVAEAEYPSTATTVYVASGENFPDALSTAPAAAAAGAPLLLTQQSSLPAEVSAEIKKLSPSHIVVVGGTGAISAGVFAALKLLQPDTTRLSGPDRYATSRALAQTAFGSSGATTVYIATGQAFPDALSADAAASASHGAVILVNGAAAHLDAATTALLKSLKVQSIVVAGGISAVSPGIESDLAKVASVTRKGGMDRYATSDLINENAFASASRIFVATGSDFPDALSASGWAAQTGQPLYLSTDSCLPQQLSTDMGALGATSVTLVGGSGALDDDVADLATCR